MAVLVNSASKMGEEVKYTRNLFLRCVAVVFLFAFASLYVQIPGLYGRNGVLPARTQLIPKLTKEDLTVQMQKKPTLLWFSKSFGIETEHGMEILALLGMFFSFTAFVSQKFCTKPIFSALWSLYFSLYQVGQTFMWFQWDVLLLEVGVLCILNAPWIHSNQKNKKNQQPDPTDHLCLWLVRWLLFRLMFSSGVVKLTSGCPSWWGLTALNVHFESMCIPSPVAWYCHHLPAWFLKLGTVYANFVEILLPPFFFFPVRAVRIVAFYLQVFLQLAIIISGNFNFFNYLTIALCLSLLDDSFFGKAQVRKTTWRSNLTKTFFTLAVYGGLLYATVVLYGLKLMPGGVIESKITFSPAEFDLALNYSLRAFMGIALLTLLYSFFKAIKAAFTQPASMASKFYTLHKTFVTVILAVFIFSDSLVSLSSLHPKAGEIVSAPLKEVHDKISQFHLTNAYGLFRKMTGVGGRPEVIIQGSNSMEGPWVEYHFKYKPGSVNDSLPFVAPHQPRLDWQMWFASLGTYHQNPWIMSLAYRLLTGQKEVLDLMDSTRNPFPSKPPKFLRADLFHYHYTSWAKREETATWTRKKVGEYFPVFSKDHAPLLDYLKNFDILGDGGKEPTSPPALAQTLKQIRSGICSLDPPFLLLTLVLTGFAIILLGPLQSNPQPGKHPQTAPTQTKNKKKNK